MNAREIGKTLEEIASLLELKGDNPFKIRAYTNGARIVNNVDGDFEEFLQRIADKKVKGIGQALTEKITTLHETGSLPYLDELRAELPDSLLELLRVPGLGAKKARTLYEELDIESISDLEAACKKGLLATTKGFGEKTQANILEALERYKVYNTKSLFPTAAGVAMALVKHLRASGAFETLRVAGSLRRKKEVVKDIDIIAVAKEPSAAIDTFVNYPQMSSVVAKGETKSSIILEGGIQCDLRVVAKEALPTALMYFTGSAEHNTEVRARAQERGLKLNEYGLFRGEEPLPITEEKDIYNALELAFIEPELREALGEVDFAARVFSSEDSFPELVTKEDLRGILHVHTTYSDGRHTLRALAQAVKDLGYEYLGISDHSQSAAYAGGLRPADVERQHREIEELNKELKPFCVFKGIESDILEDGSLDYEPELLREFDFVIASVHSGFKKSESEMTERIIRAIENPFTTILGHPTGRLLLEREGYAVDMPKVLEAAAKNKVIVEINSNPRRLDLDWRFHRRAKDLGILMCIAPDAHSIDHVPYVRYGVGVARKGWLTKADVLTCWEKKKVEEYFRAKRSSR